MNSSFIFWVSRNTLYYTWRPKCRSIIFHISFLAICMAAYFLIFEYGQILSRRMNKRFESVEIPFGSGFMSFRNWLFILIQGLPPFYRKSRDRVINKNFEKEKRDSLIWFREFYCKVRRISFHLGRAFFSSWRLSEWDKEPDNISTYRQFLLVKSNWNKIVFTIFRLIRIQMKFRLMTRN